MSNCSKCKAELPIGARYCNKCGSPQIPAAPTKKEETPKTPPVLKSKIWPDPSVPTISSDEPDTVALPDISKSDSGLASERGSQEQNKPAPDSATLPNKSEQNTLEVIVKTSTPRAQEAPQRKAAPGLIRPIGVASPRPPTNPKTPIPRRPGQPMSAPATPTQTPVAPSVTPRPQTMPAQDFTQPAYTPPAALSQSGQHLADQVTQQQPVQHPFQARPQQEQIAAPTREQVISNATASGRLYAPIENIPTRQLPREEMQAASGMAHASTLTERSQENLDATRRAAEHWRNSWRDRQRAEAGPIMDVSRGDASVPMPLMSMQNSLVRLRAIVTSNKQQQKRGSTLRFWIIIIVLICLIGGLGAFVVSIYLPKTFFGAGHTASLQDTSQPILTIQGLQRATILPGQTLHLHGEHFGADDPITFLLDTVTPLTGANGKPVIARTSSQGVFDVSLTIGKDWLARTYLISAQDSRTLQSAYLDIVVGIAGTPVTTSNKLELSVSELKFKAVIGQGYPDQQRVILTNISGAVLRWTATAIADNGLSWLIIDDNSTSGSLNVNGSDSIGISVLPTGLASSATPYKGQIVFTINGKEQLTLPVELQVVDAQAEIIFSPNPLTGVVNSANGTCKSGATLTLINLGSAVITWTLKVDGVAQAHISFLLNGKAATSDQLQPSGVGGDTQVLTLQCNNVHAGDRYQGTLYANNLQWPLVVQIQATS